MISTCLHLPPRFEAIDPTLYGLLKEQWEIISTRADGIASQGHPDPIVMALTGGAGALFGITYNEIANWGRHPATGIIDPSKIAFYYQGTSAIGKLQMELARRLCAVHGGNFGSSWGTTVENGSRTNQMLQATFLPRSGGRAVAGDLAEFGHLTHGARVSHTSRGTEWVHYKVDPTTGEMNYDQFEDCLRRHGPRLAYVDGTALCVAVNVRRAREIVDRVSAELGSPILLVLDIAHKWGLAVAKVGPFADDDYSMRHAHFVVGTMQKTAQGPNAGFIYAPDDNLVDPDGRTKDAGEGEGRIFRATECVERTIFPGNMGKHAGERLFAEAYHMGRMLDASFVPSMAGLLVRADVMREVLLANDITLVGQGGPFRGGNCHLALIDLVPLGMKGKEGARLLELAGITVNYNCLPDRKGQSALNPFGLRVATTGMQHLPVEVVGEVWRLGSLVLRRELAPEVVRPQIRDLVVPHCPYTLHVDDEVDDHTTDAHGCGAGGGTPVRPRSDGDHHDEDTTG